MIKTIFSIVSVSSLLCNPIFAQDNPWPGPTEYKMSDQWGVNLMAGKITLTGGQISIGNGANSLSHYMTNQGKNGFPMYSGLESYIYTYNGEYHVIHHGSEEVFRSNYSSKKPNSPNSFVKNGTVYVYTLADGTKHEFDSAISANGNTYRVTRSIFPDQRIYYYTYNSSKKLSSVTSNFGLQLKFAYSGDFVSKVTALNNGYDYCSPTAITCSYANTWASTTHSYNDLGESATITSPNGEQTRYEWVGRRNLLRDFDSLYQNYLSSPRVYGVRYPSSNVTDNIDISFNDDVALAGQYFGKHNRVFSITKDSETWAYGYDSLGGHNTRSDPTGNSAAVVYNTNSAQGYIKSYTSDLEGTFTFNENLNNYLKSHDTLNSGKVEFTYDNRGNLTTKKYSATGEATRYETAGYDSSCSNVFKCNKPNWVKDKKGNQTDIEYHSATGLVSRVRQPAGANGVRPETRYYYAQKYAWFKNSAGSIVQASTPIWVKVSEITCKNSAVISSTSCATSADAIITTYEYQNGSSSKASNLWLTGVLVSADGISRRTCYGYDKYGNKTFETAPKGNASKNSCN